MGKERIKLGCVIEFDDIRESDIINIVKGLTKRRKLGEFVSHLIRMAVDEPQKGYKLEELGRVLSNYSDLGISESRDTMYKEVKDRVGELQTKIDNMYKMVLEMHTSQKFGEHVGLKSSIENVAIANFLLEKQVKDLKKTIGIADNCKFESEKVFDLDKYTDNILEHIIKAYSPIVREISDGVVNRGKYEVVSGIGESEDTKIKEVGSVDVIAIEKDSKKSESAKEIKKMTPQQEYEHSEELIRQEKLNKLDELNLGGIGVDTPSKEKHNGFSDDADISFLENYFGMGN